jgi:hypothetical protein
MFTKASIKLTTSTMRAAYPRLIGIQMVVQLTCGAAMDKVTNI